MANGFNPCFNGSDSKRAVLIVERASKHVSILVLMEVTLKAGLLKLSGLYRLVSILVLMEVTLKGDDCFPTVELSPPVSILVLMEVTLKV